MNLAVQYFMPNLGVTEKIFSVCPANTVFEHRKSTHISCPQWLLKV